MIQNFYDGMIESSLNWINYFYLSPDSLIYQNNTNFSKHTSNLNCIYIYFASLEQCKSDKTH